MSWPLAASLALTTLCASLQAAVVGGFLILISSRQACWRPPGAPFFLLRRRKNRGRKTPPKAGTPPLDSTPAYGIGTAGAHGTGYQASLWLHPYPVSRCADRLPLRLRLRGCGCGLGDGVVGGFCVERSHAARRHAQRCGALKAPLKGELAARNALSEGFCGRASGAWSNNALPTSLLLRKTSQSASLTAPLSGEPLAFAALRVTTSSVALVDVVGCRPRWSCVTAAVRKRKRSGERSAHQLTGHGCTCKFAW